MSEIGSYDTREEAIRAALDELTEPGDTLLIHDEACHRATGTCTCTPERWVYPE